MSAQNRRTAHPTPSLRGPGSGSRLGSGFVRAEHGGVAARIALVLMPAALALVVGADAWRAAGLRDRVRTHVDAAVLAGLAGADARGGAPGRFGEGSGPGVGPGGGGRAADRAAIAEAHARAAFASEGVAVEAASFVATANDGLRGRVRVSLPRGLAGALLGMSALDVVAGAEGVLRVRPTEPALRLSALGDAAGPAATGPSPGDRAPGGQAPASQPPASQATPGQATSGQATSGQATAGRTAGAPEGTPTIIQRY